MSKYLFAGMVSATLFAATPALAQNVHSIVFKNGEASITEVDAAVGDIVAFYHLDPDESHQLYSTDANHQFDVKHIFKQGDHFDIELTSAGSFDVLCHAMPHMKITINVTE
jgi:plastocyanin